MIDVLDWMSANPGLTVVLALIFLGFVGIVLDEIAAFIRILKK